MPSPDKLFSANLQTVTVLLSSSLVLGLLVPAIATPQTRMQQMLEQQPGAERPGPMVFPKIPAPTPARTPRQQRVSPSKAATVTLPGEFRLKYIWPTKGVLTSGFGWRWGRMHQGIDIGAPTGTPVFAAAPGVVITSQMSQGGYGNVVKLQHPDGSLTLYAHNSRLLVQRGQQVEQGQPISLVGSTGNSTGPHLHFEVHPVGKAAINPLTYLPK